MTAALLQITAYFGLGAAAGLNASLPLLLVGLLARVGLVQLNAPFDALASDVALVGLAVLAALEFLGDKIDVLDSVAHTLLFPAAVASGAIVAGSQSGAIAGVDPGLTIIVGLLAGGSAAGVAHLTRASVRPPLKLAAVPALPVSLLEDSASLVLTGASLVAPVLVPIALVGLLLLAGLVFGLAWLIRRLVRAVAG